MWIRCETCSRLYDDAQSWTLCPHNPLEAGPRQADFCRRHDQFGPCKFCAMEARPDNGQGEAYLTAEKMMDGVERTFLEGGDGVID